jgi:hypothetical protein
MVAWLRCGEVKDLKDKASYHPITSAKVWNSMHSRVIKNLIHPMQCRLQEVAKDGSTKN